MRGLTLAEKLAFLPLFLYSGFVRLAIILLPFKLLAIGLGHHHKNFQLSTIIYESQRIKALRIGYLVKLVTRHTPWQSKCLVRAIMVRTLLSVYKIPYVLHLGARTSHQESSIKAHAWVKVGSEIIVGAKDHKQFAIVGSFVNSAMVNGTTER